MLSNYWTFVKNRGNWFLDHLVHIECPKNSNTTVPVAIREKISRKKRITFFHLKLYFWKQEFKYSTRNNVLIGSFELWNSCFCLFSVCVVLLSMGIHTICFLLLSFVQSIYSLLLLFNLYSFINKPSVVLFKNPLINVTSVRNLTTLLHIKLYTLWAKLL